MEKEDFAEHPVQIYSNKGFDDEGVWIQFLMGNKLEIYNVDSQNTLPSLFILAMDRLCKINR